MTASGIKYLPQYNDFESLKCWHPAIWVSLVVCEVFVLSWLPIGFDKSGGFYEWGQQIDYNQNWVNQVTQIEIVWIAKGVEASTVHSQIFWSPTKPTTLMINN